MSDAGQSLPDSDVTSDVGLPDVGLPDVESADAEPSDASDAGADAAQPIDPGGPLVAPPLPALTPRLLGVCRIDIDCAEGSFCFVNHCVTECDDATPCAGGGVCSTRGECEDIRKDIDRNRASTTVRFGDAPPRSVRISAEATTVSVAVPLVGDALPDAIAFRAEAGLAELDGLLLRQARVTDGVAAFEVPFDGAALNETATKHTVLQLDTEAGSLRLDVTVAPGASGRYLVSVGIPSLGNLEFDSELEIVTDPPGVAIEQATAAWLVLPTDGANLYSPTGVSEASQQARPLVYDALLDRWVATFRNDFALAAESSLRSIATSPQRTLRFELAFEAGSVFGRVSDRWTGFYDERTPGGVLDASPVLFEGDISGERIAEAESRLPILESPLVPARSELQGLPAVDACTDAMFPIGSDPDSGAPAGLTYEADDGTRYRCESDERILGGGSAAYVDSVASFVNLVREDADAIRSSCAVAVAETALAQGTTGELLEAFFNGDGETPGGQSFDAFMRDCAQGLDGLCRPSDEVLCARQLLAYAYAAPATSVPNAEQLTDAFERVSREAFLGQQLGAFEADASLRLQWLRTTDFPPIVTAVLRDYIGGLLSEWQSSVLDVHLDVVAGQYDPAGLAMLARSVETADARSQRQQLLFEMSQSWRGAVDALGIGARRWNELLNGDAERAERSAYVTAKTLDLYVLAGIASELNLRAGAGFANATLAGGLSALSRDAQVLSLSFSELIYARDGDVVVTRSLDPSSSNFNLLGRLQGDAARALSTAQASIEGIITESVERELSTVQVRDRLNNEIDAVVDELVELCGLPLGCTRDAVTSDPACAVTPELGRCGYLLESGDDGEERLVGISVSEAGFAIRAFEEAMQGILIAEDEVLGLQTRLELAASSAEAFAVALEAWNTTRLEAVDEVDALIAAREGEWTGALASLVTNIGEQNTLRGDLAADASADASAWETIARNGVFEDYSRSLVANALDRSALAASTLGQSIADGANRSASALPAFAGTASDTQSAAYRTMLSAAALTKTRVLKGLSVALRVGAAAAELGRQRGVFLRQVELEGLRDADIGSDLLVQQQIADLAAQAELSLTAAQIEEFQVDRLIGAMRRRAEAELAYERDKFELLERRDALLALMVDANTYDLYVLQTQLAGAQRALDIATISQRAELLTSRLEELQFQRDNILSLIGSPAVVFAWANRLAQAESQLDRAKAAMMDWLVALEYFAVRPFMDQRIQILLARNTYQLAEISAEMERLTAVCGGANNAVSVTVSLARLLGFTSPRLDSTDERTYTGNEQFLATLARADVSVSRQTRIGGALSDSAFWASDAVWAIEFPIDLDTFPNLASSCNAKVLSFDVALIGDELGEALPTVTLVHSGSSRMRSCQPDLADYVAQFGEGATRFNEVTRFRTQPRSISPVADVGGFSDGPDLERGNFTLGGLPLASDYVLVIDRSAGENPDIDWEQLEDIEVRVNFSFQDFFPRGECQ